MLNQALAALKVEPEAISWDRWEALAREYGAKSQLEVLADIGLGKRLSFVVAQALARPAGRADETPGAGGAAAVPAKPSALTLRGVEGVAIQYAKCCRRCPAMRSSRSSAADRALLSTPATASRSGSSGSTPNS